MVWISEETHNARSGIVKRFIYIQHVVADIPRRKANVAGKREALKLFFSTKLNTCFERWASFLRCSQQTESICITFYTTSSQHCINVLQMFCVCWVGPYFSSRLVSRGIVVAHLARLIRLFSQYWPTVGLMLGHPLRRWDSIKQLLGQCGLVCLVGFFSSEAGRQFLSWVKCR